MIYVCSYLAWYVALAFCFLLTGLLVERLFLRPGDLAGLRWVGQISIGMGLWIGVLFVLASLHLLHRSTLLAALLVILLILFWGRSDLGPPAGLGVIPEPTLNRRAASVILLVGIGVLMSVLFVQTLWPRVSWDANVYHLTIPRIYLEAGGFRRIPFNVYSNWPLNTELLFAMALALRGHVLAKLVHFGLGALTATLIFQIGRRTAGLWVGWVAVALFLVNPIVLLEIRVAYVDLAAALFLTLAFFLVHRWLEAPSGGYRSIAIAGLFAGLAAGTKLTGIIGAICLAILLVSVLMRRRETLATIGRTVAALMVPAVALLIPWFVKTWILTGNPFYPFFFELFGGPEWSSELQHQLGAWQRSIGMGRSVVDYLLLPVRVILEGDRGYQHFDGELAKAWIGLIPLSLWASRKRPMIGHAMLVCGAFFVVWALSSQQIRFLIPMLPLLALSGALSIDELIGRFREGWLRGLAVWGTTMLLFAGLAWEGRDFAIRSRTMLRDYQEIGLEIETLAEEPVYRYINENLPPDARILMLNTNHGFFCRREYVADSFFEASQIGDLLRSATSASEISDRIRGLGITHLLIENRDRGIRYPESLPAFLNDSNWVLPIYRTPDEVFDIAIVLDPLVGFQKQPGP